MSEIDPFMIQFALAVNLAREIRRSTCLEAVFFDPAFTAYDRRVIESEGNFSVMRMDEKCARAIDRPTLFYMPHCEAKLYDSLLRANWSVEQLSKMVCELRCAWLVALRHTEMVSLPL